MRFPSLGQNGVGKSIQQTHPTEPDLQKSRPCIICEEMESSNEVSSKHFYMASLANEIPIDARTQSLEDCVDYISPNYLLLGGSGPKAPQISFEFEGYPYKRLRVNQTEVNWFWKKWSQLAGTNLFVRSKWHTKWRNVAIGDIVWLADQKALKGLMGIVRDVNVRSYPSYPVSTVKPVQRELSTRNDATILHRDIRQLICFTS
ncbi:hypothetical protein M9458_054853 [Cirrhinus mrigala]|uniref:DUF5641 domain-containing protein n=1 Tax=Cirrhinus mrigala TaxID=683832 RepID=A0ABD0MLF7_CIRMR